MITLYCTFCGVPFKRRAVEVRRQKQQFCSYKCWLNFYRSMDEFDINNVYVYRLFNNPAHTRVNVLPKRTGRPHVDEAIRDNTMCPMLTEEDIRTIRREAKAGKSYLDLSKQYETPANIIVDIVEGRAYAWVAEEEDDNAV